MIEAARCEALAVAALVAHVTVRRRASRIGAFVVSDWKAYGVSNRVPSGERATLPPSSTTSGLTGHCRENGTEVRLCGDSSPRDASGVQPSYPPSSLSKATASVYAPTVSAFHAWPGSSMGSTSLRSRCLSSHESASTFPAARRKRRRSRSSPSSRNTIPSSVVSMARPAAKASTAADHDVGWPSLIPAASASATGFRTALTAMPNARLRVGA